jgi:hypothetical protein
MYCVVTIDTEEDNWGEYRRQSYSVNNIARLPRLQQLFAERGVRPTYLISHPVATSPSAIELLGAYHERRECEIGTHLHPWNTPPVEEERTVTNSYLSNLPRDLQYRKMKTLHDEITRRFGVPTSYRSGRWGFSDAVAKNLIRLGYRVDSSILPLSDWTGSNGPDYRQCFHDPFLYRVDDVAERGSHLLLEVPATVAFLQTARSVAAPLYWWINRTLPSPARVLAVMSRARLLNHISLTPEIQGAPHMIRLARTLLDRGVKVLNVFFHSPTLLPGCAPFVTAESEATEFLDRIRRVLDFVRSAGVRFVTLSELTAENVGASFVRTLA